MTQNVIFEENIYLNDSNIEIKTKKKTKKQKHQNRARDGAAVSLSAVKL